MKLAPLDESFADWDALLALILSAFASMHSRIDPPSSALSLTPQSLRQTAMAERAVVLADDDSLLGCLFLRPEPPDCLYIGKLAVAPDAQGKGIGRTLLRVAEEEALLRGFSRLRLETRIELVENHRVFAHWGFEKTREGTHPGFARPTYVEMCKEL